MNSIKSLIFSKENNKAIVRNISIAGLSILIVIAIFLISLRVSFFNELNRIQIQRCFELKSRIQAAFEDEKNRIKTLCDDWSHWDELYYSVKGGTDKFYEDNANPNIFEKLRLDIICTLDNSGKIVGGRKYDRKNDCSYSIDGKYLALLQNSISSILLAAGKDTFCDAVIFENEILLGGISPIYRNDGSGPSNGFIFMGRLFSDDARRQIWGELSENIHIIEATEYEKYQRSQTHSFDLQGKDCVIDRKGDSLALIWPLRFVDGKTLKAFCLKINNDVLRVFFRNTLIASAIFILFIAIVAFLFKILFPLFRFSEAFSRTGIWSGVFSFSSFVVLIGGILISIVVFWFYRQIETNNHEFRLREECIRNSEKISDSFTALDMLVTSCKSFYISNDYITKDELESFVTPFMFSDKSIVDGIIWGQKVKRSECEVFENTIRQQHGFENYSILETPDNPKDSSAGSEDFFPIVYAIPETKFSFLKGLNFTSETEIFPFMLESAKSGKAVFARFERIAGENKNCLILPIYETGRWNNTIARLKNLKGFFVFILDFKRLIEKVELSCCAKKTSILIEDDEKKLVYFQGNVEEGSISSQTTISLAGKEYYVIVSVPKELQKAHEHGVSFVLLGLCLGLSFFIFLLLGAREEKLRDLNKALKERCGWNIEEAMRFRWKIILPIIIVMLGIFSLVSWWILKHEKAKTIDEIRDSISLFNSMFKNSVKTEMSEIEAKLGLILKGEQSKIIKSWQNENYQELVGIFEPVLEKYAIEGRSAGVNFFSNDGKRILRVDNSDDENFAEYIFQENTGGTKILRQGLRCRKNGDIVLSQFRPIISGNLVTGFVELWRSLGSLSERFKIGSSSGTIVLLDKNLLDKTLFRKFKNNYSSDAWDSFQDFAISENNISLFGANTAAEISSLIGKNEDNLHISEVTFHDKKKFVCGAYPLNDFEGKRIGYLVIGKNSVIETARTKEFLFSIFGIVLVAIIIVFSIILWISVKIEKNIAFAVLQRENETQARLTAEKESKAKADFLKSLLEVLPIPVYYKDADMKYIDCNKAFENAFGLNKSDIIGKTVNEVLDQDQAMIHSRYDIELLNSNKTRVTYETKIRNKEGTEFDFVFHKVKYFKDGDFVGGILAAALDVSEVKRLTEQNLHMQKIHTLGQLAAGVAHDFNNILTPISGYAHMLDAQTLSSPSLNFSIKEIIKSANRAKDLSRRLLLFARKEKPEKLVFDVNLIIQDTEKMLKHTLRPDILQEFNLSSEESILINADKSQIEQVIMNLVVNAQDAMPQGGKITIETRKTILDHKEAEKLGVPPGAFVVISVSDTGIGMSQNTLQQIFEPYFTTKKAGQGTGLGLPISYSIIKDHGGAIKVESKLGRGSKFEVYLPIAEYKEKRSDEAPNLENYEGTGNILLVDDDNETLRFTKKFLERLGYNVRDFSNPVAALEYAKSTNKLPESLLITDLTMPRIGGKELAIKIKEKHPTIKIIFISGYATENLEEYLSIGSAFISKPFNLNETAKKIRDVLTA